MSYRASGRQSALRAKRANARARYVARKVPSTRWNWTAIFLGFVCLSAIAWFAFSHLHRTIQPGKEQTKAAPPSPAAPANAVSLQDDPNPYARIDELALSMQPHAGETPALFAVRLTALARNDTEKARAIFRWIAENVSFDLGMLDSMQAKPNSTDKKVVDIENPVTIMNMRKTICTGYARLFDAMAKAAGLECEVVSGWSTQDLSRGPDHSWNAVKIEGHWHLVDAGWAAGSRKGDVWVKEFDAGWFFKEPKYFLQSHFPTHPLWQFVDPPWTKERFDSLPKIWPRFFEYGLTLDSNLTKTIPMVGNQIRFSVNVPQNVFVTACLYAGNEKLEIAPQIDGRIPGGQRYEWLFTTSQPVPDSVIVFAGTSINGDKEAVVKYLIQKSP